MRKGRLWAGWTVPRACGKGGGCAFSPYWLPRVALGSDRILVEIFGEQPRLSFWRIPGLRIEISIF
eukprot:938129-Amorphochlora_amoeboformis.AAC.2